MRWNQSASANEGMMKSICTLLCILAALRAGGQDSSAAAPALTLSAYAELYYCFDLDRPVSHERPSFFYNHSRHNEVNLNLGYLKAAYTTGRVRSNLALMAGTYPQYNLAGEPELLRHVFEANAGIRLSGKEQLWLDAGILPSHIGFESAVGMECLTLTRSIMADNSPYYEAGARLGYKSRSTRWYAAVLLLKGWQRIQRRPGNNTPAFGTQLTCTTSRKATFNWSTYTGNEYPDSIRKWRHFHNLYATFRPVRRLSIQTGVDIGMEQQHRGAGSYNVWYAPVLIARYTLNGKTHIAGRAEYYADQDGVIVTGADGDGVRIAGLSLNLDYEPFPNTMIRLEGRWLRSRDDEFRASNGLTNSNSFLTCSFAVAF